MQWEQLEKAQITEGTGFIKLIHNIALSRAQVPGGWLVMAVGRGFGSVEPSITFYPDPTHSWEAGPSPRLNFNRPKSQKP